MGDLPALAKRHDQIPSGATKPLEQGRRQRIRDVGLNQIDRRAAFWLWAFRDGTNVNRGDASVRCNRDWPAEGDWRGVVGADEFAANAGNSGKPRPS